jgi:signal transduction histidine kinase
MFRSATFKLTLWYIAIVMAISLAFSVVLYHEATSELMRGLHRQMESIYNQFPVFQGDPSLLRPAPDYAAAVHRIWVRLIGFNIIVFFGAGLSSYWLARRTLAPIEEAHEQQKRFTADVSHELRTPLTALKMESEVALMNPKNGTKELRQTLTSNLEEVSKLEALINNILRLTRLEADELRQNFTSLSSQTIIETALKQVKAQAAGRKIKLESQIQNLPLSGDHDSLVQLLVILLDNAIKYSSAGSSVTITAKGKDRHAVIQISDHGQGIERQALEHVFDRFYRADNSRNKVAGAEGFGLGLSIAKMIADVHNAAITLSSQPGKGTTATVTLPLATPDLPEAPDTDTKKLPN